MVVSVRLFAGLRERAGSDRVEVELPDGAVVSDLLAAMGLAPRSCVVAINREYADERAVVRAGDEVALVPPVSGGAGVVRSVRVTGEPLDLAAVAAAVRDPAAGAVVLFEGVTREVLELDYEAYAEMAEPKLRAIGEEVAAAYGLSAVALEHRTGTVPLGEPSVIVAASAPHRGEAFDGARSLIDRVKAEAPIWKVEVDGAGVRTRVEGTLPSAPSG
ncbi:MAG: molybdenum cofactor biosynthesis protein MoaE [Solirubrobacteraceae bacterium]